MQHVILFFCTSFIGKEITEGNKETNMCGHNLLLRQVTIIITLDTEQLILWIEDTKNAYLGLVWSSSSRGSNPQLTHWSQGTISQLGWPFISKSFFWPDRYSWWPRISATLITTLCDARAIWGNGVAPGWSWRCTFRPLHINWKKIFITCAGQVAQCP